MLANTSVLEKLEEVVNDAINEPVNQSRVCETHQ